MGVDSLRHSVRYLSGVASNRLMLLNPGLVLLLLTAKTMSLPYSGKGL